MKRLFFTIIALVAFAGGAQAQDWLDAVKKAATNAIDEATDGKLTQLAIAGEWKYSGPGVKFEGEDIVSNLGAGALESTVAGYLEKAYTAAGIRKGACTFTFDKDKNFTAKTGSKELTGTYEFDSATHAITLNFAKGTYNLGTMQGNAYISGTGLQLVFPVTKLTDMVVSLGSKVSQLSTVTTILKKYENVYLGFEFSK